MPEETPEKRGGNKSPSILTGSQNNQISKNAENKKKSNKRLFALPSFLILIILGAFLTNIVLLPNAFESGKSDKHSIEIYGYAWNLLEDSVIDVLVVPNPSLTGWQDSNIDDVKHAFNDWIICIRIFTSQYGYSYLNDISFAIHIAGVDDLVEKDYDITVKWVDNLASKGAAGGTVVLSNSNKEITKASITIPLSVNKNGEVYYLSSKDIRNIMADEIGHAMGLGHSNFKEDALHGFYDFPHEVICHSSLDIYALAMAYNYLPKGEFEPPTKSTINLATTSISYHKLRDYMY